MGVEVMTTSPSVSPPRCARRRLDVAIAADGKATKDFLTILMEDSMTTSFIDFEGRQSVI